MDMPSIGIILHIMPSAVISQDIRHIIIIGIIMPGIIIPDIIPGIIIPGIIPDMPGIIPGMPGIIPGIIIPDMPGMVPGIIICGIMLPIIGIAVALIAVPSTYTGAYDTPQAVLINPIVRRSPFCPMGWRFDRYSQQPRAGITLISCSAGLCATETCWSGATGGLQATRGCRPHATP
jgi:hypothetical protein